MNEAQSTAAPLPVNTGPDMVTPTVIAPGSLAHQVALLLRQRLVDVSAQIATLIAVPAPNYLSLAAELHVLGAELEEASEHASAIFGSAGRAAPRAVTPEGEEETGEPAKPITDATRAAILELHAKGNKPPEIARALGLKGSRVRRVLKKAGVVVAAAPAAPAAAAPAPAPAAAPAAKKRSGKKAGGPF